MRKQTAAALAILPLLISPAALPASAGDEQALAQALTTQLAADEVLWLEDGTSKFLGLMIPDQSGTPKGGAIILHDAAGHPDWPEVIRPLRRALPPRGWATLAIQLPPLQQPAPSSPEQQRINGRIRKAAEQLRGAGINNIALIGHGSGAAAAVAYLAGEREDVGIRGLVAISLRAVNTGKSEESLPSQLEKVKVPLLDIYGSREEEAVTATAQLRIQAAMRGARSAGEGAGTNKQPEAANNANRGPEGEITYRQVEIEGADHRFTGQEERLVRRIQGWLDRHIKGVPVKRAP